MIIENNLLNVLSINKGGVSDTGNWFRGVLVNIALIFGLLMFASKAPKFLTDLLGLPDVGSGDMADMFKPAWQRVGGSAALGAGIGAYRNAQEYGESPKRALMRAVTAGAHATGKRLKDIASGKSMEESYKTSKEAAMARTNKNLEYANRYQNTRERMRQRRQERLDAYTGVTTGAKKASSTIEAANRAINARNKAWGRAQDKVGEHANWYNGGTVKDSHGKALSFADMYALFEKDAPEMWKGQKVELAEKYQSMKDNASVDFLRQAFAYGEHGDAQSRNEFAENVYSIIRSGADKSTVERLLTINLSSPVKDKDGNIKVDPKTGEPITQIFAGDVAERIEKMNRELEKANTPEERQTIMKRLIDEGIAFTDEQALDIANFAKNLNKVGGNVRLEATKTQTTAPKDS